ncbi:DNA (cytosine-5-)-methyltransferase [Acetoanaerobium noterae]|uniref:DNA (cytosine-5-)-methyltransferase n=1 Tax=Acetoanaerobium noterae TaxID=745369 RepID=UPI003341EFEF
MIDKTLCELFAGVGGFRIGLEQSSTEWQTVWANQWEPGRKSQHAYDCYCKHFGEKDIYVNQDISSINKADIPDHNLLVGGFPCQDYSVARTGAKGIQGKKGVLWWDIRDTIEVKKPKFIILENVDRLLKSPASQRGRDFGVILACLNELEYDVEWRVINAADYGYAQKRRRTFIFGYSRKSTYSISVNLENPLNIINTAGFFANTFPIEKLISLHETILKYDSIADISENFRYDFGNTGFMKGGKIYTTNSIPVYEEPILLRDLLVENPDEKYFLGDNIEKWKYLKGSKKIERISKTGHKYVFSEGSISFPDSINSPARTMLTSESSLNRSTHVIEDPKTKKLRLITPIEAERIQGFPDDWTNTGMPEKFRYFCMGNALVVNVIERMGYYLNEIFNKEKFIDLDDSNENSLEAI